MLLSFREYDDNYNSEIWQKRKIYLDQFMLEVKKEDFLCFSNEKLLDTMNSIDELIEYYLIFEDMQNLEKVMQIQNKLIKTVNERKIEQIDFNIMVIHFKMANAYLYKGNGKIFKSFEYYKSIFEDISKYMVVLKKSDLQDKEKEFILWNYAFAMNKAALCTQDTEDIQNAILYCKKNDEIMEELKKYTKNTVLIDQMADFYSSYGVWFYKYKDIENGRLFNEKALELLACTYEYTFKGLYMSDYYISRVLWAKAFYYCSIFIYENNEKPLLKLSKQIETFYSDNKTVSMIITAISGFVNFHLGMYFQQNDVEKGLYYMEKSSEKLESSLKYLENCIEDNTAFFIAAVCVKIYCSCPGLYSTFGEFLAINGKYIEAEKILKKSLQLMEDNKKYRMANSSVSIISTNCFFFLGYICQNDERTDNAEFYYKQAIFMSESAEINQSVQALTLKIKACAFLSEMYLEIKRKKQAAEYSQKGLEACDNLFSISPESVQTDLHNFLKEINRKSKKKFVIF